MSGTTNTRNRKSDTLFIKGARFYILISECDAAGMATAFSFFVVTALLIPTRQALEGAQDFFRWMSFHREPFSAEVEELVLLRELPLLYFSLNFSLHLIARRFTRHFS